MKVYRIEDENGHGPFRNGHAYMHQGAGDPPGPVSYREKGTELYKVFEGFLAGSSYFFGFESKAQLERWFSSRDGRQKMAKAGSQVTVYEVAREYVAKGNWQVAFIKDEAVPCGQVDLVTLKTVETNP